MMSRACVSMVFASLLLVGCDEPTPKRKFEKPGPSAAASLATPLASSSGSSATPKPKKKAADCKVTEPIEFTDPVFEKAVKHHVQKDGGPVMKADLAAIKILRVNEFGPTNELDPCLLPLMTNLKELIVGPGEVDDLSAIETLTTLDTLRVAPSRVSDIGALAKLGKLERIDLSHTLVTDIKPLALLVNLTTLSIDGDTGVSDLSPLAGCKKLAVLSLRETSVKDLSPLHDLRALKSLDIRGSSVSDFSPVSFQMAHGMKLIK